MPRRPSIAVPSHETDDISTLFEMGAAKGEGAHGRVVAAVRRDTGSPVALKAMTRRLLIGHRSVHSEMARRVGCVGEGGGTTVATCNSFSTLCPTAAPTTKSTCIGRAPAASATTMYVSSTAARMASKKKRPIVQPPPPPPPVAVVQAEAQQKCTMQAEPSLPQASIGSSDLMPTTSHENANKKSRRRRGNPKNEEICTTPCGSGFYIAPEVIRSIERQGGTPLTTTRDGVKAVDVWSCGITMFFLLAGRPPFRGKVRTPQDCRDLLGRISSCALFEKEALWGGIGANAKDLVARLLAVDASERITAADALKHPFFAGCGESLSPLRPLTPVAAVDASAGSFPATPTRRVECCEDVLSSLGSPTSGTAPRPLDKEGMREALAALHSQMLAIGDQQGGETEYTPPHPHGEGAPPP